MSKKPYVAVILAAYNGELFIENQIQSIINQENVNIELFISLDLSSDNSQNIISKYSKKYSNINLLSYDKRYGSASKNFLNAFLQIDYSKFDYIALSDQDDIWMKRKIINGIDKILQRNSDIYSSNALAFGLKNKKNKIIDKSQKQTEYDFLFEGGGPGCTYVMKKNFFQNFQIQLDKNKYYINDIWSHDWLIYCYARLNKYEWYIDKNYYILYRQHNSNQLGANLGYRNFLFRAKFVLSGKAIDASLKNLKVCGFENISEFSNLLKKNKYSYFKMIINFYKCRRKIADKVIFLICSILLFLLK